MASHLCNFDDMDPSNIGTVDLAVPFDDTPDQYSEFASMRDSFYILMNLNQYKMKPVISMTREAEGLLRIALFSKDLKLLGTSKTLNQKRVKLAQDLRSNRRRGVVPIFISTLWFILALGISIEAAFGDLGSNPQAHNLAMGLFVSWLPILILCSILDRNPIASDDIQRKLNKLVDLVCNSLLDPDTRREYIASFADLPQGQHMAYWVELIAAKAEYVRGDYFRGFAGQARTRFHYGAAYAILIEIEKAYIAERGRNWLSDPREARAALVLGQTDRGFTWFDGRQLWTVIASILFVGGSGVGAFVLSFNTPTIGLGCRTGGYLIFFIIALVLMLAEIDATKSAAVKEYWIIGTGTTCAVMALGMSYIVLEWLVQAHLSTEDYDKAMNGLRRVRKFRYATLWIKYPLDWLDYLVSNMLNACQVRGLKDRCIVVWTRDCTFEPEIGPMMVRCATDAQRLSFHEASV
ncbi:hypothetical protein N0V95_002616 [Ascochyta clinopodiicola]|nr:hypothetical protein N0V95_002616 [Ascochyta clinopodiicola]